MVEIDGRLGSAVNGVERWVSGEAWRKISWLVRCFTLVAMSFLGSGCAGHADSQARHVIKAFRQGNGGDDGEGAGNCASIAVIKASIYKWGADGIFERSEGGDGRVHIRMRDGAEFDLEKQFLDEVRREAHFVDSGDAALLELANVAYAAMALRLARDFQSRCFEDAFNDDQLKLMEGRGTPTPIQALKLLNGGINTQRAPELLGVQAAQDSNQGSAFMRYFTTRSFLGRRTACVANSGGHAWFVSNQVADKYGEDVDMFSPLNWFRVCGGFRLSGGYCLDDVHHAPVNHCKNRG